MRAGELRHRVEIQRRAVSTGLDTWTTVATVWAAIEPLSGGRYFEGLVTGSDVTGTVRIRYRADVTQSMRLLFGSRIFNIVSVIQPKELRDETRIIYKEVLSS